MVMPAVAMLAVLMVMFVLVVVGTTTAVLAVVMVVFVFVMIGTAAAVLVMVFVVVMAGTTAAVFVVLIQIKYRLPAMGHWVYRLINKNAWVQTSSVSPPHPSDASSSAMAD